MIFGRKLKDIRAEKGELNVATNWRHPERGTVVTIAPKNRDRYSVSLSEDEAVDLAVAILKAHCLEFYDVHGERVI